MKYSYDYICEPRNITIIAKSTPLNSKGIDVIFYVDGKEAYLVHSTLRTFMPLESDIDDYVAKCCSSFKRLNEHVIQDRCDEDKIMLVLYIYRALKKVEKRSGTVVWRL